MSDGSSLPPETLPAPSSTPQNRLLANLPARERDMLESRLERVKLDSGAVLAEPGQLMDHVLFPEGVLMLGLFAVAGGRTAKTACVGIGEALGLVETRGDGRAISRTVVEMPGTALRCSTRELRDALASSVALRALADRYSQFFASEIAVTAGCHAIHTAKQRMARWLMFAHQTVRKAGGPGVDGALELPLTHESLSNMVGARMPRVIAIVQELEQNGAIAFSPGRVCVTDQAMLRRAACGCNERLEAMRRSVLGVAVN